MTTSPSLRPSCFPLVRRLGRARGKPILRVWSPSHCEAGPHVCIWPHFLVFDLRRSTSSSSCPSRFFPLPGPGMGAGSLMMKLVLFILFASSCRFWLTSCMTQSGPPGPLQDEILSSVLIIQPTPSVWPPAAVSGWRRPPPGLSNRRHSRPEGSSVPGIVTPEQTDPMLTAPGVRQTRWRVFPNNRRSSSMTGRLRARAAGGQVLREAQGQASSACGWQKRATTNAAMVRRFWSICPPGTGATRTSASPAAVRPTCWSSTWIRGKARIIGIPHRISSCRRP